MEVMSLGEKLIHMFVVYGLRLLYAIVIFIVGRWIARAIVNFVRRIMSRSNVDETVANFAASLSYIVLLVFVIVGSLHQLGIQTASLVAVLGAAGLATGLALQGSLSNFAAGVLIILFKPFKDGDYVEGGGTAGTVEKVEIFSTQLVTPDNKTVIIPNGKMMGDNIVNYSAKGTRRVDMVFSIGYSEDIDKARDLIREVIASDKRIFKDPSPVIVVSELADSRVNLTTRVWSSGDDYWDILFDTTETVKKRFDAENITIPFPQQDVHMYQH